MFRYRPSFAEFVDLFHKFLYYEWCRIIKNRIFCLALYPIFLSTGDILTGKGSKIPMRITKHEVNYGLQTDSGADKNRA